MNQRQPSPQPQPRRQCQTNPTPLQQARLHRDPLPSDPLGQRLAHLFPNGWHWIYAPTPQPGDKPEWQTIKPFPLTPIEMWQLHQDPNCLIGTRPDSKTHWGTIDLDIHSPYHPQQDPTWLPRILNGLESIGITRVLICRSSASGGLHLWLPLSEAVPSFGFAITLKYHLEALGLKLRPGHCEIFPNPKRYVPQGQGYSHYAALRFPMQPGSGYCVLDNDLNPRAWTLKDWLDAFDLCAEGQDLPQLKAAIEHSQQNHRIRHHRHPQSLAAWQQRIELEKQQGWTGPGQSNEKFKLFACEARVFLGMDSPQAIAQHIQEIAQTTPGFYEHSNHTQDLPQRSQEVAQWAMRYYWPLGDAPQRDTSYHSPQSLQNPSTPAIDFSYHQAKREAAQSRIKAALAQLQEQSNLPPSATARAQAIAQLAHISQQTLYKPHNKPLWHPDHLPSQPLTPTPLNPAVAALESPKPAPEQEITQPLTKPALKPQSQTLKLLWLREITQLFIYVGFCLILIHIQAAAALTLKGQRAAQAAQLSTDRSNRGGLGGNLAASISPSGPSSPPFSVSLPPAFSPPAGLSPAWSQLRASLPEGLQAKIAAAERQRQRQQEREDHR